MKADDAMKVIIALTNGSEDKIEDLIPDDPEGQLTFSTVGVACLLRDGCDQRRYSRANRIIGAANVLCNGGILILLAHLNPEVPILTDVGRVVGAAVAVTGLWAGIRGLSK